jgi:hypothetical protein
VERRRRLLAHLGEEPVELGRRDPPVSVDCSRSAARAASPLIRSILLSAITSPRPASTIMPARRASCSDGPIAASITRTTTSARSIWPIAIVTAIFSTSASTRALRRIPAVSTRM